MIANAARAVLMAVALMIGGKRANIRCGNVGRDSSDRVAGGQHGMIFGYSWKMSENDLRRSITFGDWLKIAHGDRTILHGRKQLV